MGNSLKKIICCCLNEGDGQNPKNGTPKNGIKGNVKATVQAGFGYKNDNTEPKGNDKQPQDNANDGSVEIKIEKAM